MIKGKTKGFRGTHPESLLFVKHGQIVRAYLFHLFRAFAARQSLRSALISYSHTENGLTFDRAARYPLDVITLHTHKQGYDNATDDERSRAKDGKIVVEAILFRVYHFI